ncbi:hypothetical protein CLV62_10325 [Dysgonomonas alginatilytica]|uniref:Uncharacterized protein n=1 Tax=Dysgonomonas alginatilytica TaxID=1605892 RepID=A0A2V3PTL5_9BACT|nr:hypothetical protein CLV62_10325 [Dysgonomonas alginatilytica]
MPITWASTYYFMSDIILKSGDFLITQVIMQMHYINYVLILSNSS